MQNHAALLLHMLQFRKNVIGIHPGGVFNVLFAA
jgi:hypothetical protein